MGTINMRHILCCLASLLLLNAALADRRTLATFGTSAPTSSIHWIEANDPVMGGQSHGNFSVSGDHGVFQGEVKTVPSLKAPGFCQFSSSSLMFKDLSTYSSGSVSLVVRSSTPDYQGFKLDFRAFGAKRHHGGHELQGSYKTGFTVPAGDWTTVNIPLTKFSSDWSDFTGECSTRDPDGYQHQCCTESTPEVCPSASTMTVVDGISVWAEGVAGVYQLEIQSISISADTLSPEPLVVEDEILLVDFKGQDKGVTHTWKANNDPVMGGQSYSAVSVADGKLNFTGACKIVPALKAPGFITVVNTDTNGWVDVSSCEGLQIMHKSATPYEGFRISFGHAHPKGGHFFAYGYKAHFVPIVGSFGAVKVPFKTFTDFWDDGTGKPIHTCEENSRYCPDATTLSDMKTMSIWAEGVEGDIQLEVESIKGYGCSR